MQNEPVEVTLKVSGVLEKLGVSYLIGGEVSERQWRDVLGVLKTRRGELDLDYLRKWADDLHVDDLLERGLLEAG